MPSVVFCDSSDCRLHDDCYGQCDAAKLVVRRGVCAGSTVLGRNVSENDLDEQLRAENEKLKAENKKLTRELEAENALAECLGHSHEDAKSENEKLRKLVQDLRRNVCAIYGGEPCSVLCQGYDSGTHICYYDRRMSELGVRLTDE